MYRINKYKTQKNKLDYDVKGQVDILWSLLITLSVVSRLSQRYLSIKIALDITN